MDDETSRWVAGLDDATHARLAAVGLVRPRTAAGGATVGLLLEKFFANLDVKPITVLGYEATRKAVLARFGASTPAAAVEPLAADEWRREMKTAGLSEATISKRIKLARQMFRQGVRWKMVAENPFADVKAGSQMNKARQRFIGPADAAKVLAACPDGQWRLLFALSRFGGLRCPSEHLGLRWADVDWEHGRFRVTSTKTERHEGRGERWVPIFPELRPYLLAEFEAAEPGTEHVITRYRQQNANLRTQLQRIIRRAGLTQWPRLFHNLRATRQTELSERFPSHVVCGWIGNTERVAANHYLQTTDEHFAKASGDAAQNQAQNRPEGAGNGRNDDAAETQKRPGFPGVSDGFRTVPIGGLAATGIEPVTLGL